MGKVNRLRVMDEHGVGFQLQTLGVFPVHLVVTLEVALPQIHGQPLQAIVKRFRHLIELRRSCNHLPADGNA